MKLLILVLVILAIFQHRNDILNWLDPTPPPEATAGAEVIMYSTEQCGYCDRARDMFVEKGIPFDERDVNRSREAAQELQSVGGRGVPTFVFNDGDVLSGWNRQMVLQGVGYR